MDGHRAGVLLDSPSGRYWTGSSGGPARNSRVSRPNRRSQRWTCTHAFSNSASMAEMLPE